MRAKSRRWVWLLAGCAGLGAALVSGAAAYLLAAPVTPPLLPFQFDLRAGSTLTLVAHQLTELGILRHPVPFVLLGRVLGKAGSIKAGNFEIEAPITPLELLRKITEGEYRQTAIVIPEGWTFRQMRQLLDEHPALRHETTQLSEADLLKRLEIDATAAEGWFFPNTYYVSAGSSDLTVLRRSHRLMRRHLAAQWELRAAPLPLASPYEALILASIIEKETGRAEDRPMIAAVFVNRLRIGMKLQTDPTVIYGLGAGFDGNLRKRDLVADTAYNTYIRTGLPPTPIALPGLGAIKAALNPAGNDALYFVARGDGTSQFSQTLAEHERAVTKYQRSGRH